MDFKLSFPPQIDPSANRKEYKVHPVGMAQEFLSAASVDSGSPVRKICRRVKHPRAPSP